MDVRNCCIMGIESGRLHSSVRFITVVKAERMRLAGHEARLEMKKSTWPT
jgi:hypothetical protein